MLPKKPHRTMASSLDPLSPLHLPDCNPVVRAELEVISIGEIIQRGKAEVQDLVLAIQGLG